MSKKKEMTEATEPMVSIPAETWEAMVNRQNALEEKINAQNQTPADRQRKIEFIPEVEIQKFLAKEPSKTRFYRIIETPSSYHGAAPRGFYVYSLFPDKVSSDQHLGVADQTAGVELRFKNDTSPAWGSDILNDARDPKYRVKYADLAESNGVAVTEDDIKTYSICDMADIGEVNRYVRGKNGGWGEFSVEDCLNFMRQHMASRMFDDARDGKNWSGKILTEEQMQGWVDLIYTPLLEERRAVKSIKAATGLASRAQRARGEAHKVLEGVG